MRISNSARYFAVQKAHAGAVKQANDSFKRDPSKSTASSTTTGANTNTQVTIGCNGAVHKRALDWEKDTHKTWLSLSRVRRASSRPKNVAFLAAPKIDRVERLQRGGQDTPRVVQVGSSSGVRAAQPSTPHHARWLKNRGVEVVESRRAAKQVRLGEKADISRVAELSKHKYH